MEIIVRKYEHINRSFSNWDTPNGKYIRSKKHYEQEMAKGGFVPFKEVNPNVSKWIPSADLKKTLGELKVTSKNGKINCGSRLKEKMESMGVSFNPKFIPKEK